MNLCKLSEEKTSHGDGGKSPKKNCNYYREMNEDERNEKLTSAISYCKDSKCRVSEHQSRFHDMKDLSDASFVIGIQIHRDRSRGSGSLWDVPPGCTSGLDSSPMSY
ncbi:hypothetical protein HYC85_010315 [Camellia sinensis]|uniref:Uncharacterized protein n=1 Tax=Camellia sinensis TaxID=4442 RepID=A0A7J7HJG5_CAMSI|nr:hypothetical protein HYC85_010315 [Camellia sinensis]